MTDIHESLDALATHEVPATNLLPRISARLNKEKSMTPRTKIVWTAVLTLLGLALVTSAGYALVRYLLDPGLNSARQSGLITDVNATALPTAVHATPEWGQPSPATQVGLEQTISGVTLTLNWVYLADGLQAFGTSTRDLPADLRLGLPTISYTGVVPEQYTGALWQTDADENSLYVAYQIVRSGVRDGRVNTTIAIPLLRGSETLGAFHFELPSVPVDQVGGGGGNSFAVTNNGVQLTQQNLSLSPTYSEALVCYSLPTAKNWLPGGVSLRFIDANGQPSSPEIPASLVEVISDDPALRCVLLGFDTTGLQYGATAALAIKTLTAPDASFDYGWYFYTGLTNLLMVPGASSPGISTPTPQPITPLATETIGDLTATLQWAYIDAFRASFRLGFTGWQKDYFINGVSLLNPDGSEINSSQGFSGDSNDQSNVPIDFQPLHALEGETFLGELRVTISNDHLNNATLAEFHFKLNQLIYPAITLDPMLTTTANGIEMTLTRVSITPAFTYLYLCYNKPTNGDFSDWQVSFQHSPVVQIGADKSEISTGMLLYDRQMGDIGKGPEPGWKTPVDKDRCMKVGFTVGHHAQPEQLTITIPSLDLSLPEVIPADQVRAAQKILAAQGIEVNYITVQGNGGGGAGFDVKKKPDGMTDQQAYQKLIDALGYNRPGPWIFELEINP